MRQSDKEAKEAFLERIKSSSQFGHTKIGPYRKTSQFYKLISNDAEFAQSVKDIVKGKVDNIEQTGGGLIRGAATKRVLTSWQDFLYTIDSVQKYGFLFDPIKY
jgi:hypothetical protein